MAMARLDRPSVFVYGGTIQPGKDRRDVVSVFEAVGQYAAGNLSEIALKDIEATSIPGPGSWVACTPQTPWHPPSKLLAYHSPTHPPKRRYQTKSERTA